MESVAERHERLASLEAARAARRIGAALADPDAVEIAPGRGDLRRSSVPVGPSAPLLPMPMVGDGISLTTVDGRQISYAKLFAEQPKVAAAVMRMLTWAVRVPLKVYRRTGDDSRVRLRPGEHPLATGIQRPWEGGYPAALTMALLGPFLVHGNSTTEIIDGSNSVSFEPHDWRMVRPIKPKSSAGTFRIDGWDIFGPDGRRERSASGDTILHAKWWSPLGPEGVSPLRQLGTTLAIDEAAQRYQRQQFKNGARPPSAITATPEFLGLDPAVRDALLLQLREDITMLYAGPENGGRPALLPPGLDWKPIGHTSREAELIEQRYLDGEEVGAVYQIPAPFLNDLRRATFSNIVELRQVAYTDGLGPPLVIIEQVITAAWQHLSREDDVYVEFDFAGVLRGDFLKEINALRLAVGSALLTPNEGRAILNRPKSDEPGADQLWIPGNNWSPMSDGPTENRPQRRERQRAEAAARAAGGVDIPTPEEATA